MTKAQQSGLKHQALELRGCIKGAEKEKPFKGSGDTGLRARGDIEGLRGEGKSAHASPLALKTVTHLDRNAPPSDAPISSGAAALDGSCVFFFSLKFPFERKDIGVAIRTEREHESTD